MFHFLGFIFFFVLIILLIGFFILWRIVNTFLGLGRRMSAGTNSTTQGQQRTTYQRTNTSENTTRSQSTTSSTNGSDKKKVFADNEGEYVEFEEIKD